MKKQGNLLIIIASLLSVAMIALTLFVFTPFYNNKHFVASEPSNLSIPKAKTLEPIYADFYVSPDGDDNNDGTINLPFATIERAQKAARKLDKTYLSHIIVAVKAGTYTTSGIKFTEKDSGTSKCTVIYSAYGDGDVVLSGAQDLTVPFTPTDKALIQISGADYFSFSGFTVQDYGGNGITANGKFIDINRCTVRQIGGIGIKIDGQQISVANCSITSTGNSGVTINGGSRDYLSPGNCSLDNTKIRKTSTLNKEQPAVVVSGMGNAITNNDIALIPSVAIRYEGNRNSIEYNYIHSACTDNEAAAAIESDFRWDYYGNLIRYNCISKSANGLKACSGTYVRSNIFINISSIGYDNNGGNSSEFTGNLLINCSVPIKHTKLNDEAVLKKAFDEYKASPYNTILWGEKLPAVYEDNYEISGDDYHSYGPSLKAEDNIILQSRADIGDISADDESIKNNLVKKLNYTRIFVDSANGDYRIKADKIDSSACGYKDIPFDQIGLY